MAFNSHVTRDALGRVLCHHGRIIACGQCGEEYALELDGPASGAPETALEKVSESTGTLERVEVPMDPHNDFDKHDRGPYDIAPATNVSYAALRKERDELSERVERYALEFETLTRRWMGAEKVRAALVGLVGVDGKADLEAMEAVMRLMPAPAEDKAKTIDAIHALIATVPLEASA